MKLKKIASLMLAGVMAVSMLAGCEGSANSGEITARRIRLWLLAWQITLIAC